jgi:hypothetical protein
MTTMKSLMTAAALMLTAITATPATAQQQSYTEGTVWTTSRIKVLPGQGENYLDYLSGRWKQQMEFFKKEGWLISYHILRINHRRDGEPHLILVQQWKDYATTAQRQAMEDKFLASIKSDPRTMETASGQRQVMREQIGATEYQELVLK